MENASFKVIVAILIVGLAVSLFLNVYVLTRPSIISPTYVADMKVTDLNWMEQVVNASENLYFVSADFNLTNLGNSTSALVELYLKVCDPQGNIITSPSYRWYYDKTRNDSWVGVSDSAFTEATFYWQSSYPNPYAAPSYSMSLFYHKPIGVETHVQVAVYGSVTNPQVRYNT
jgi:hypothetical protein